MRGRVLSLSLAIAVALSTTVPASAFAKWDASPSGRAAASPVSPTLPFVGQDEGPTDTGRVIVKFRHAPSGSQKRSLRMDDAHAVSGPTVLTEAPPEGVSTEDYAAQLEASPLVEYAEPDYLLRPAVTYSSSPNDPDFHDDEDIPFSVDGRSLTVYHAKSWPLRGEQSSRFDQVWPALTKADAGPGGVRVAVIDTGYHWNHPARGANIIAGRDECATYNALTGALTTDTVVEPVYAGPTVMDVLGVAHGTMTASEVGEWTNNGDRSVGAAWDTQVAIYKVQGVVGVPGNGLQTGDVVIPSTALVNAINDAVADAKTAGAKLVINISLELLGGSGTEITRIQNAINNAHAKGAVIVAASGNSNRASVSYPAACTNVIAVGAYETNRTTTTRASFSNYGSKLDLMAPGQLIWGPATPGKVFDQDFDNPGYTWWSGTSMASPYVAAAAALLLRVEPTLSPADVESLLETTAVDRSTAGWDSKYGWGLLDAFAAYRKLAAPVTTDDAKPRYEASATITLTAYDRDTSETVTHYTLDLPGLIFDGNTVQTDNLGTHTLKYWSVDANGVAEDTHTVTFEVLPQDDTPPVTTSNATDIYAGRAPITLTANDFGGWGVAQTYYRIDGGATKTGTSVSVGSSGSHTLEYWSTDLLGNVEETRTADFTVTQLPATATIAASASTISRGAKVKLSGYLTPGRVGDVVRIWYKAPGSSTWKTFTTSTKYYRRTVTTVSSAGKGTWSPLTYALSKHGRYYFRVVFSGDETYLSRTPSTSKTISVYVR